MIDGPSAAQDAGERQRHPARVMVLSLVTAILVVGAAFALISGTDSNDSAAHGAGGAAMGLAVAPLDLSSVTPDVAGHYEYAKAHKTAYMQIPCYCGCASSVGHRDLYDCFVRSDGRGWDAHASGCGVCVSESIAARELLDRGEAPAAVRASVIAKFGSTLGTTPPQS